jgi:hypothetical protein
VPQAPAGLKRDNSVYKEGSECRRLYYAIE